MLEFPRKSEIKSNYLLFINDQDRTNNDFMKLVDFTIDKVANDVANYCNISVSDIPEQLDGTLVSILSQYINTHSLLPSDNGDDRLQSLTEGDVSYKLSSKSEVYQAIQSANVITDNFLPILQKYRKLVFNG